MLYTQKVQDLFLNPHNLGEIENPDGVGEVGNAKCGDIMKIWIKVDPKSEKLESVKFKTFGCAAAIATSSIITDMAQGKTLEEAEKITNQDVANELGGLPPAKMHCSNLAADALKKAIQNYRSKFSDKAEFPNLGEGSGNHYVEGLIEKSMTIGEIIENYPHLIEVLLQYGFHCVGCQMNSIESLEEGALKHAVDIDELVDVLNATLHS